MSALRQQKRLQNQDTQKLFVPVTDRKHHATDPNVELSIVLLPTIPRAEQ